MILNQELISVIIPVYNVERYVKRCVESLLNQTYTHLEIILIDDGSTDMSPKICDGLGAIDNRIRVIHQENSGAAVARNAGIDVAKGNYIMFADADDYVSRDYVEILYKAIKASGCKIAQCDYVTGKENGWIGRNDRRVRIKVKNVADAMRDRSYKVVIWGKIYTNTLFEEVRFKPGRRIDDEFVTYKLAYYAGKIAIVDKAMYYYFDAEGSIMRRKELMRPDDAIEAYNERIRFMQEQKNQVLEDISRSEKCIRMMLFYINYSQNNELELSQWVLDEFKKEFSLINHIKNVRNKLFLLMVLFRISPQSVVWIYNFLRGKK